MLSPGGVAPGPPSGAGDRPRTTAVLTGVRLHPSGRTDKNLCRCFGAPARRVFPDHLIRAHGTPHCHNGLERWTDDP